MGLMVLVCVRSVPPAVTSAATTLSRLSSVLSRSREGDSIVFWLLLPLGDGEPGQR